MLPRFFHPGHDACRPFRAALLCLTLGWSSLVVAAPGELACPADTGVATSSSSLLLNLDKPTSSAVSKAQVLDSAPCFVSYSEIVEKQASSKRLLVDVRKPRDYARLRIPGSLNISPSALTTKAFLKPRAVVLVAAGHRRRPIESLCRQLRGQGFTDVVALDGGLNAWIGQGGEVSGNPLARDAVARVSGRDFLVERDNPRWLVVGLDGVPLRTSTEPFAPPVTARNLSGPVISAAAPGDADSVVKRLSELSEQRLAKGDNAPQLLVVSRDGSGYEALAARLRGASLHQVYFLEGGLVAYRRLLSDWQLRQQARRVAMAPASKLCGARR